MLNLAIGYELLLNFNHAGSFLDLGASDAHSFT